METPSARLAARNARRAAGAKVPRLLPGVALLSMLAAGCSPERYIVQVSSNDLSVLPDGTRALGNLDAERGTIEIGLPPMPASGPVVEAFIADRTRPTQPLIPFPGPYIRDLDTHLTPAQIRQMRDGGYVLVVRTRGSPAARIKGQAMPWPQVSSATDLLYLVHWSRPRGDGVDRQSGADYDDDGLPLDAELRLDPPTGRLCLNVDYSRNDVRQLPVEATISVPGAGTPAATLTLQHEQDTPFQGRACTQAAKALADALEARQAQVSVTTAAAPAREFVGRLSLERFRSRGATFGG